MHNRKTQKEYVENHVLFLNLQMLQSRSRQSKLVFGWNPVGKSHAMMQQHQQNRDSLHRLGVSARELPFTYIQNGYPLYFHLKLCITINRFIHFSKTEVIAQL